MLIDGNPYRPANAGTREYNPLRNGLIRMYFAAPERVRRLKPRYGEARDLENFADIDASILAQRIASTREVDITNSGGQKPFDYRDLTVEHIDT